MAAMRDFWFMIERSNRTYEVTVEAQSLPAAWRKVLREELAIESSNPDGFLKRIEYAIGF